MNQSRPPHSIQFQHTSPPPLSLTLSISLTTLAGSRFPANDTKVRDEARERTDTATRCRRQKCLGRWAPPCYRCGLPAWRQQWPLSLVHRKSGLQTLRSVPSSRVSFQRSSLCTTASTGCSAGQLIGGIGIECVGAPKAGPSIESASRLIRVTAGSVGGDGA